MFIFLVVLVFLMTINVMAQDISVGPKSIEVPENWDVINQDNKEEYFEKYSHIKQVAPAGFSYILLNNENIEKYYDAAQEKDHELLIKYYPAFLVINEVNYKEMLDEETNNEEILNFLIQNLKERIDQQFDNVEYSNSNQFQFDNFLGKQIDYLINDQMNHQDVYFADRNKVFLISGTSTLTQDANNEIETIVNKIVNN